MLLRDKDRVVFYLGKKDADDETRTRKAKPHAPQTCAYTNSATSALKFKAKSSLTWSEAKIQGGVSDNLSAIASFPHERANIESKKGVMELERLCDNYIF